MCRVDERVYVRADGRRSMFQDTFKCDRGKRRNKICSNAEVRRTEYTDPTSSPVTSSPITPIYHTQARRPSVSSRPSTRDGSIQSLKPEIHIDITAKKGKPHVSITTGKSKRESVGSTCAYESAGSEASHTVRTGYPDISPPPLNSGRGGLHPQSGHYRSLSSEESFPSSGHVHHNSSDYDTPSLATGTSATSSDTRPVLHHAPRTMPSQINTTFGQAGAPASPYRNTTGFTPRAAHNDISYAPEITGRDEDRQRRRDEQRQRQEALDREVAANVLREENRRVHFELSRAHGRAEERANKTLAGRADGREQLRQQENKARVAREAASKEAAAREAAAREAAAREAASKKSKPSSKPAVPSRRTSVRMSSAEAATQQQLIDAEARQMRKERADAEAREREELLQQQQRPTLQQQQQDPRHYDPRGQAMPCRDSSSQSTRPTGLTRSYSIHQPNPPTAAPRTGHRQPPVSYYNGARNDLPAARERRPSSSQGSNPFGQPSPSARTNDPWDVRNMRDQLPNARGPEVGHTFPYPQQASHRMQHALYTGEYETDSDEDLYRTGKRQ